MKIALGTAEGEVYLFMNEQGRDKLIENLKHLEFPEDAKSHEHFHLFSEEWGGYDLAVLNTSAREAFGLEPVHHLKVFLRPPKEDVW